jgi:hypothetical protein
MKLTKHFDLKEMTQSDSATKLGIINVPTQSQIENLTLLCNKVLEPIRVHFDKPILISSGYRSRNLNVAIGGSKTSQHCYGQAVDINNKGSELLNAQIFSFIKDNLDYDQLIWEFGTSKEPDWVHVSYATVNRKQVLKATKLNGKTTYKLWQK